MTNKVQCVECGSDMVISHYDYNTGKMVYQCEECKEIFTEDRVRYCDYCGEQVLDSEAFYDEGFIYCSECRSRF